MKDTRNWWQRNATIFAILFPFFAIPACGFLLFHYQTQQSFIAVDCPLDEFRDHTYNYRAPWFSENIKHFDGQRIPQRDPKYLATFTLSKSALLCCLADYENQLGYVKRLDIEPGADNLNLTMYKKLRVGDQGRYDNVAKFRGAGWYVHLLWTENTKDATCNCCYILTTT